MKRNTLNTTCGGSIAAVILLLMVACATTRLQHTWVSPEAVALNPQRMVAMSLSRDPGRRRAMEASIAEQIREKIPGVEVTESSTLLNDQEIRDEGRVRERLEAAGFDARIVM